MILSEQIALEVPDNLEHMSLFIFEPFQHGFYLTKTQTMKSIL